MGTIIHMNDIYYILDFDWVYNTDNKVNNTKNTNKIFDSSHLYKKTYLNYQKEKCSGTFKHPIL